LKYIKNQRKVHNEANGRGNVDVDYDIMIERNRLDPASAKPVSENILSVSASLAQVFW
jgi:hypothetical protein